MTKFSSLARAQVTGPEGGAWGGGASGGAGEGAAGVDVLEVSSSKMGRQVQKFMLPSRVGILRNERTQSY